MTVDVLVIIVVVIAVEVDNVDVLEVSVVAVDVVDVTKEEDYVSLYNWVAVPRNKNSVGEILTDFDRSQRSNGESNRARYSFRKSFLSWFNFIFLFNQVVSGS